MQPARNPVVPQPRIQDGRMLFPEVLHSMVEYCDKHHNQVLCWMDDGNGFVVKDRRFFEFHILPLYFRHGRFGSLERQLANYGFRRDGRGVGYYRHEQNLFQRDRPELASSIPLRHRQPRAPQAQQNNANVGNLNNNNNDANQAPNNGNINNIGRNEGIGQNQVALGANVPLDHLADAAQGLPAPPAVLPFGAGQAAGLQQHVAGEAGGTAGVGLLAMPLSQQAHEHNASVAASSSSSSMANAHHDFTMSSSQPHISNISLSSSAANPSAVTSGVASHSTTTVQGQGFQTMTTRSEEQQELHPRFDNMHLSETQGSALPASHGSSHPGGTPLTTHKRLAVLPVLIPPVPEGSWLFRSDVLSAITNTVLEPAVAAEESPAAVFEGVKNLAMMTTEQKTCGCNRTYTVSVTGAAGVGKTTMVSIMTRSVTVREYFSEGIAWIDLASTEIVTVRHLTQLYKSICAQVSLTDGTISLPPLDEALASFRGVPLNSKVAGGDRSLKIEDDELDDYDDDDEEEERVGGGGTKAQMEYVRSLVSASFVHRKILIVVDNLYRPEDLRWFDFGFDEELKGPCRVVVTTRLRHLRSPSTTTFGGDVLPMIEVPPLGEQDAVAMLIRHSGRGRVPAQEEEHARRIVHFCDCLPFAIEIAAHTTSVRFPNTYSFTSLALNSEPLFQAGDENIIKTLERSFNSVWDAKTKDLLKLMFAGVAKLPYTSSGHRDVPVSGVRPWLPYSAVEKAMGDATVGDENDMGDNAKKLQELNLDCLRSISSYGGNAVTNVILLALGALVQLRLVDEKKSVVKDALGSETVTFEYQVSHDLLIRYAENIISKAKALESFVVTA